MEQVYNYTQNDPSSHATELTSKATQIQNKANTLKDTVTTQSNSELASTQNTDLETSGTPQPQLAAKATTLKEKAEALHTAADGIVQAAKGSPLQPLNETAEKLKNKAGNSRSSGDSLYDAANELATHSPGGGSLEEKVEKVIQRFEAVKTAYEKLMEAAKELTNIPEDQKQKVTAVEKEYKALEAIYDGMLNLTKLHKAAGELKEAAGNAPALSGPATTLEQNVKKLRDKAGTDNYSNAQQVIQEFEKVESEYNKLDETQKDKVKGQFEALKNLYDKIFKFTKIKHYSDKLHTAANELSTKPEKVNDVIINFNAVVTGYNQLDKTEKEKVKSAFEKLREEYSEAIYVYKCHFITLLSS